MRIGLFGSKSDPLKFLHMVPPERARVQHNLDKVYVMTAGEPTDKHEGVTDKVLRFLMTRLLCAGNPHLIASRIEIDRDGPSYTADTLRELMRIHGPEHEYFLIIGEDRAPTLHGWHDWSFIRDHCQIRVAPRFHGTVDKTWLESVLPPGTRFDTIEIGESSTWIRQEIAAQRSVRYILPDDMLAKIEQIGLYGAKPGSQLPSRRVRAAAWFEKQLIKAQISHRARQLARQAA